VILKPFCGSKLQIVFILFHIQQYHSPIDSSFSVIA
jgi:hypothetical protein